MLSLQVEGVGEWVGAGVGIGDGFFVGALVGTRLGAFEGVGVGAGVSQFPALHASLAQSLPTKHTEPTPQPGHSAPPQSMSVSRPFLAPSLQVEGVGAAVGALVGAKLGTRVGVRVGETEGTGEGEVVGLPVPHSRNAVQTSVAQSEFKLHTWPSVHRGHTPPPQSVSVSRPLRVPSAHTAGVGEGVGAADGACVGTLDGRFVGDADGTDDGAFVGAAVSHLPALHASLAQSLPTKHTEPTPQPGHSAPPQSTSVSRPFLAPSAHVVGVGANVGASVGDTDALVLVGTWVGC
jgi:hypothetical protein